MVIKSLIFTFLPRLSWLIWRQPYTVWSQNKLLQGMKSPGKMCSGVGQLSLPIPRHPSKILYRTKFWPIEYINGRTFTWKTIEKHTYCTHSKHQHTYFPHLCHGSDGTIDLVMFFFVVRSLGILDPAAFSSWSPVGSWIKLCFLWDPARF